MGKPLLDVSDVLTDPDFCDTTLVCTRGTSSTTEGGLGTTVQTTLPFSGVVTSDKGVDLNRDAVGEHATGSIWIATKFRLRDSGSGFTADIVAYNGATYVVRHVNPYSSYGAGFIEAICDLLPLAGVAP